MRFHKNRRCSDDCTSPAPHVTPTLYYVQKDIGLLIIVFQYDSIHIIFSMYGLSVGHRQVHLYNDSNNKFPHFYIPLTQ